MASSFPNAKDDFTEVVDATPGDVDSGTDVDATLLNAYRDAHIAMQDTLGLNTDDGLLGGYGDLAAYLTARFTTLLDLDSDYLKEHDEAGAHGGAKKLRCEVVADAAARGAISSPREGDLVLQSDTDTFYFYDGAAWDIPPAATHAILDGSRHSDSVADAVTRGSLIYGNDTPKWDELVIGAAGTYLRSDGTDASWGALADHDHTGDAGDGAQISHDTALTGISVDDHHNEDHKARHKRAGADEVDGDQLDIDWNPSTYTPATTPAEAANVDDLTAHLYGIDQALDNSLGHYLAQSEPFNSKGNSFATVQGAIDDLAGAGWVFVPTGTWSETLVIDEQDVLLFGAGWSSMIDGAAAGHAISISGHNAAIQNLAVKTTAAGGNAYNGVQIAASNSSLFNVRVRESDNHGIHVVGARARISSCYVYDCDVHGICVGATGDGSAMVGNVINLTDDDGIFIHADAENCVVDGNRILAWTNEAIDDDSGTSTIGDNDTTV